VGNHYGAGNARKPGRLRAGAWDCGPLRGLRLPGENGLEACRFPDQSPGRFRDDISTARRDQATVHEAVIAEKKLQLRSASHFPAPRGRSAIFTICCRRASSTPKARPGPQFQQGPRQFTGFFFLGPAQNYFIGPRPVGHQEPPAYANAAAGPDLNWVPLAGREGG